MTVTPSSIVLEFSGVGEGPLQTEAGESLLTEVGAAIEVETTTWTDISEDILSGEKFFAKYGIFGQRPTNRVASPGSMAFTLDNSEDNSAELVGYYTPEHPNVRSGFDVGIDCRLGIEYDSDTYYKWTGRISKLTPDAGVFGKQRTVVKAKDWMGDAVRIKPEGLTVQVTKRGDELLTTALAAVTNQPPATTFATGQSTFAYAFDEIRDRKTSLAQVLKNIAMSEKGLIYQAGDTDTGGVLTFEDRNQRTLTTDILIGLDDTEFDFIDVVSDDGLIYNDISASAYPRIVDTDATLQTVCELQGDAIAIAGGASATIIGDYIDSDNPSVRIGGYSVVTPTTDDWAWSASDSDLGIVTTIGGNSTKFVVTNNGGGSGNLTKLQIRGKRVLVYQPIRVEAYDSDSIADFQDRPLSLPMPYQNQQNQAQSIVNSVLADYKDQKLRTRTVNFPANSSDELMLAMLQGEPGKKIGVDEAGVDIYENFFINGVQLDILSGNLVKTRWYVIEANDDIGWFIIDTSEIDGAHLIGY